MRILSILFLCILANCSAAQGFHRVYGHWGSYPWRSSAASSDAYYLAHLGSFTGFEGLELIKVDLEGDTLWSRGVIGSDSHLACGPDAVYLSADGLLVKVDTAGTLVWANGTTYDNMGGGYNSRVHVLNDGVLTVGERDCNQQTGDIHYGITLARYDADGGLIWGKTTTLPFWKTDPGLNALASVVAPNGDIVIAGNRLTDMGYPQTPMLARFTSTGELIWIRTYTDSSGVSPLFVPTDLITTSDGNFALAGSDFLDDGGLGHVLKFDDLGNMIWARRFHTDGWIMQCRSLIEDSEHRLVMAGGCRILSGWAGFLIARWDLDGTLIDAFSIGDIGMVYPFIASVQASGQDLVERAGQGYVIAGSYAGQHALMTLDYNGMPGCPELATAFTLLMDTVTWSDLEFGTPPVPVSDATGTLVNTDLEPIPQNSFDVCPLVTSILAHADRRPDLRISPVPATDAITCKWTQQSDGVTGLELIDAVGRAIQRTTAHCAAGPQRVTLPVAERARGIYLLRVTIEGHTTARRVILE